MTERLRITGGTVRNRRLLSPPKGTLRPASDLLRQAVFNILGAAVKDAARPRFRRRGSVQRRPGPVGRGFAWLGPAAGAVAESSNMVAVWLHYSRGLVAD